MFNWEGVLLAELQQLLEGVTLIQNGLDRWVWLKDSSGVYSVRSTYTLLLKNNHDQRDAFYMQIWAQLVPSKVESFVWKLSLDRVPTLVNLASRRVEPRQDRLCIGCLKSDETGQHLFFECNFFYMVWMECLRWWGVHSALHNNCKFHFFQFMGLLGTSKEISRLWMVVWYTTIWEIWKFRNGRMFTEAEINITELLERIKLQSWRWVSARSKTFCYPLSCWFDSPGECVGLYTRVEILSSLGPLF